MEIDKVKNNFKCYLILFVSPPGPNKVWLFAAIVFKMIFRKLGLNISSPS